MGTKMIRKLQRYNLDFDLTWTYVKNNLERANTLSNQLLKLIDFNNGNFFSYFSPQIDKDKIYQFLYSIQSSVINSKEIVPFIINYMQTAQLSCLFEDTVRSPKDFHLEEFNECGLLYDNEIYYFINQNNLDSDLVLKCLNASSAIWHSLCVLTKVDFNREKSSTLTLDMIAAACLNTKVAIIGTYDDEGYIFWEKID
jgi:hypothetical protein